MLTPQETAEMIAGLQQLYEQIEDDLLRNVAKRFSVLDEITPETITEWQVDKLNQIGALRQENIRVLAARSGKTSTEITRILEAAGYKAVEFDDLIYQLAFSRGLLSTVPQPARLSPMLQTVLQGAADNTRKYFNLINTTALESAQQSFITVINQTYLETSLGITDYNSAVRKAVMQLADKGITGAHYVSEAGRRTSNHIDVAVRRCIVTSTSQTAGNMQIARAKDWGAEYVEVSSHMGARPEHAVWQGKIFRLNGSDAQHENLVSATGYGTVRGLCGANCRHTFYPFFEGISEQTYKPYDLKENEKAYKESQVQRGLERDVRAQKRRVLAADATGDAEGLKAAQLKLKEKEAKLKAYTQQTGRYQRTNRQQVYGFDRSQASRAAWTKRKSQ